MTVKEYLKQIDDVIANGKYKDNWQSLYGCKTPDWYYRGKFGIFIHWGIYSVPAFGNEWYSRNMYNKNHREFEHHIKTYGSQKDFGYKDFIPMFKGENFDAAKWIEIFKNAGAKFVMPVAEHHDGFAMYETEFNRWNAKEMGPMRDIVGELKAECEKQGLTFCASNHRAEHYFFMGIGTSFDSDMKPGTEWFDFYAPAYYDENVGDRTIEACDTIDEFPASEEYLEDWMVRVCELIDKYQPKILYFDWWIQNQCFKPYLKKLPLIIITAQRSGAKRLLLISSIMLILSALQLLILSAAHWAKFSRIPGRRTLQSASVPGDIQRIMNLKLLMIA